MGPCSRLRSLRSANGPLDMAIVFSRRPRSSTLRNPPADRRPSSRRRRDDILSPPILLTEFPVLERAALLRIAIFKGGRSFGNYANFHREAFFALKDPTSWCPAAVDSAASGFRAEAWNGESRLPNSIRIGLALRAIDFEPIGR